MVHSFDELCKSQGFDYTGDNVIENLTKALNTTNSGPISVPRTSPLMLENLDGLMTEVLITEKHFKLFNAMTRVPSAGPYFEWNRHSGFGSRRGSIGFAEGGGPKGSTSAFSRNGIYNKYYGVQGGITHQMLIAGQNGGTFEDPRTRESRDRAMELFERVERETIFGDSTLLDESGNAVHWDGLLPLLTAGNSANVIDMAGAPLSFSNFDNAAQTLVKQGKLIGVDGYTGYMSPHVLAGLGDQYKSKNIVRESKGDSGSGSAFVPGFKVPGYDSQFGFIGFENSILMEEVDDSTPLTSTIAGVPGTVSAATGSGSGAGNTLDAGTYYYKVAAFNDTGETLPSVASAAIVATAGQKITLTLTKPSGNTTGYRIYRSATAGGVYKWIGRVACNGSATQTWDDTGAWRTTGANGDENGLCVMMRPDPRDLVMSQMAPLVKMDLPQVNTTFPFLLLLYCALVLKAPERLVIFKNCGKYVTL